MTKQEGLDYIQRVLRTYDTTWRELVYCEGQVSIQFRDMIEGASLLTSVDFNDEDDVTIYNLMLDDDEQFLQENGYDNPDEAYSELNLWVEECIEYGYFWRYN